jgi:hypothetical protein
MAGFEIRDSIGWVYGSGFPKSLDVSKAIDKRRDEDDEPIRAVAKWLEEKVKKSGKTTKVIEQELGIGFNSLCNFIQPNRKSFGVPRMELWEKMKLVIGFDHELDDEVLRLNEQKGSFGQDWEQREVTGKYEQSAAHQVWMANYSIHTALPPKEKKDKPATPEAQKWQGWGTALKPALEPIVVARKPLGEKTVAENVLTHGTGGLNIDASRIVADDQKELEKNWDRDQSVAAQEGRNSMSGGLNIIDLSGYKAEGRWPANLILDEYTAELLDEQSGQKASGTGKVKVSSGKKSGSGTWTSDAGMNAAGKENTGIRDFGDTGGASRFFYVAKASKRDRNEGLEDLPEVRTGAMSATTDGTMLTGSGNERNTTRQNFHPTVKPTELMRYLVKLITPPGGTVLDPFTGSGSTGKAAILEGFDFIGIELTEDYWPIIEGRLKHAEAKVAEAKENIEAQPQGLF